MYEMILARVKEMRTEDLTTMCETIAQEFHLSVDGARQTILACALADVLLNRR